MRLERIDEKVLMEAIWDLGFKWKVRMVGVESISIQTKLFERIFGDFAGRSVEAGWCPKMYPITYKGELKKDKGSRIMGLAYRFEQGRIKLPQHCRTEWPWHEVDHQIKFFTSDLKLLKHDVALDSIAMFGYLVKPRGNYREREPDTVPDAVSLLMKGQRYFPGTKIPVIMSLNAQDIPHDAVEAISKMNYRRKKRAELQKRRGRHRRGLNGGDILRAMSRRKPND